MNIQFIKTDNTYDLFIPIIIIRIHIGLNIIIEV